MLNIIPFPILKLLKLIFKMTMARKIEHYNFIFKHFKAHFILGVYGYMVKQKTAIVPILLLDLIFTIEF